MQIATGRFFDEGVERYDARRETTIVGVSLLRRKFDICGILFEPCESPSVAIHAGRLHYNPGLEARQPRAGGLVAVGYNEIEEQFRGLLQVATERVWDVDPSRIARLQEAQARRQWPLPTLLVEGALDEDGLLAFGTGLLSLPRTQYVKVMPAMLALDRAIRAAEFSYDAAFAIIVFAMESLVPENKNTVQWQEYPERMRVKVDRVLVASSDRDIGDRVRTVLLDDKTLKAQSRFLDFIEAALPVDYFARPDAVPRSHLRQVLKNAYTNRSAYAHALHPVQKPVHSSASDHTLTWHEGQPNLTLQGALTLAFALLKGMVAAGPHLVNEPGVAWRSELPGIVQARLAYEYWLYRPDAYTGGQLRQRLADVIDHLLDVVRTGRPLLDLRNALEGVRAVFGSCEEAERTAAVAIVHLWRYFAPSSAAVPWHEEFVVSYGALFDVPSIDAAVLHVMVNAEITWPPEACNAIWSDCLRARYGNKASTFRLAHAAEAGVCAEIANVHLRAGDHDAFRRGCQWLADECGQRPDVREHALERLRTLSLLDVYVVASLRPSRQESNSPTAAGPPP